TATGWVVTLGSFTPPYATTALGLVRDVICSYRCQRRQIFAHRAPSDPKPTASFRHGLQLSIVATYSSIGPWLPTSVHVPTWSAAVPPPSTHLHFFSSKLYTSN
ncbi:unnamed protein product, partial [Ectocarpus sp. 13 AM-2016]